MRTSILLTPALTFLSLFSLATASTGGKKGSGGSSVGEEEESQAGSPGQQVSAALTPTSTSTSRAGAFRTEAPVLVAGVMGVVGGALFYV